MCAVIIPIKFNKFSARGHRARALAVAVAALGAAPYLAAADTWDNSSGNNQWSTASNWADNTEPTSSDPVIFPDPRPTAGAITLSSGEVASSLTFNSGYTLNGGGISLTTGSINCNTTFQSVMNTFVTGSAGLAKSGPGQLSLGNINSFTGTVSINGGTLVVNTDSNLGAAANPVTLNGGELTTASFTTSRTFSVGIFGGTISTFTGTTLTLTSPFGASGSNPLNVKGSGTLALNASSSGTRSGNTYIESGTVRLNNGGGLGTGGAIVSGTAALEVAGGVNHFNTIFLESGATYRTGGAGAVHSGTILVQASGSSVVLDTGALGSTLQLGGPGTNQYTGGSGAKTIVNGLGRVTILTAVNDYQGDWQIDSGTLRAAGGQSLGSGTSPVVVNSTGTLQLFSVTFNRDITLNNNSTLAFENGGQSYGTHALAPGAGVGFALKGAGNEILGDAPNDLTGGSATSNINVTSDTAGAVLTLNHSNDYAGGWTINTAATVRITDANALGTGTSAIALYQPLVSPGGTLELGGVTLARDVRMRSGSTLRGTGAAAVSGTITFDFFGTANFATSSASDVLTIGDAPNDYAGTATTTVISGPGTVVLPFANDNTGAWQLNGGTLRIGDSASMGTGSSPAEINNGATLELANVTLDRAITLNNGAAVRGTGASARSDGTTTVASGATITIGAGPSTGDVLTLGNAANDLTGGGGGSSITITGPGTVVLTQDSNYVGTWNVLSGKLQVGADAHLGNSLNSVAIGGPATSGTLRVNQTFATARLFSLGNAGGTIEVDAARTMTITSPVHGGTLTKSGAGTLVLSGSTTRTTGAVVEVGVLRLENAGAVGSGVIAPFSGATLELGNVSINNNMFLSGNLRGTGNASATGTINATGANLQTGAAASDMLTVGDAPNDLTGGNAATHINTSGAGTVYLPFQNNYQGNWGVISGTLRLGHAQSLGTGTTQIFVQNSGVIELDGITFSRSLIMQGASTLRGLGNAAITEFTQAQGALTLATGASAADVFTVGDSDQDLAGVAGSSITVAGAGTVVLPVASNHSGSWLISSGTLRVSHSGALGPNPSAVTINSGGALELTGGITVARPVVINGGGALRSPSGANIINGAITMNAGATTVDVASGALLTAAATFSAAVPASVTLNKTGLGKFTVNQVRVSAVNITGGTLAVAPSGGNAAGTSSVSSLAISGGSFDLGDNKLIVAGGNVGTSNGTTYSGITGLIQSGRNAGAWNGNGLMTSRPAAATGLTAMGIKTATSGGTFGGVSVSAGDALVMYTYGGDANLDGFVSGDDYTAIDFAIAVPGAFGWANGDFNYDGFISADDYTVIDFNIAAQGAPFPTGGAAGAIESVSAVPEPAGAILALAASLAVGRRRRRV